LVLFFKKELLASCWNLNSMTYPNLSRRAARFGSLLAASWPATAADAHSLLAGLERTYGGRLGVAVLNTVTGRRIGYRASERFAMCSTFKFLAAAFALSRVDRGQEHLERRLVISQGDILAHSPITGAHVGGAGMTIAQLCEAVVIVSDNAAANLLLASFGGPAALTRYARTLGDNVTRLDRTELALNDVKTGDPRDTTTPDAMLGNLNAIVLGNALSPSSRNLLTGWLIANQTGDARLRAGLPKNWRIGDKTGSGPAINNAVNDIAVVWPATRGPFIVTAYYADSTASPDRREFVISQVARIAGQV
jgi:beta-lactamase class A